MNWPMMRYSDVLLMYAEAENELNGPTASQDAMKRVRYRAFDSSNWAEKSGQLRDFRFYG
ncbi:MAG: RagB/SusD family nutrient uptake outer membrane protein [Saprospiraceae bacterium]